MTRQPYLRPTRITVDLDALQSNWNYLNQLLASGAQILPVVKANAYGHGAPKITRVLESWGAVGVAVADVVEGTILRDSGYEGRVLCLGAIHPNALHEAFENKLTVTIHSLEVLERLSAFSKAIGEHLQVHVKLDTGMNRLGLLEEEWQLCADRLKKEKGIQVEGIFTHLAETDDVDSTFTAEQLEKFQLGYGLFEETLGKRLIRHAGNSGGLLYHNSSHLDWVRPGLALFGHSPSLEDMPHKSLKPALTWKAPILQIKSIPPGAGVSYGRRFRTDRETLVATVAVGYGDGYFRAYQKVGVGLAGQRVPTLGVVCMDLLMIDISDFPKTQISDEVTLLGNGHDGSPSILELADALHSLPYEVLTSISARVSREYVSKGER